MLGVLLGRGNSADSQKKSEAKELHGRLSGFERNSLGSAVDWLKAFYNVRA
jgi:hypothetical protein